MSYRFIGHIKFHIDLPVTDILAVLIGGDVVDLVIVVGGIDDTYVVNDNVCKIRRDSHTGKGLAEIDPDLG